MHLYGTATKPSAIQLPAHPASRIVSPLEAKGLTARNSTISSTGNLIALPCAATRILVLFS